MNKNVIEFISKLKLYFESNRKKILLFSIPSLGVITAIAIGIYFAMDSGSGKKEDNSQKDSSSIDILDSRLWMEYSMEIVKEVKPTPPESARFYAYVSAVYADTLESSNSQVEAGLTTRDIINQIYPDRSSTTDLKFGEIYDVELNSVTLSDQSKEVFNFYSLREKSDGFDSMVWDGEIPEFEGAWVNQLTFPPFAPTAGNWKRWVVPQDFDFQVPAPPQFGSAEYLAEVEIVKEEVAKLDANRSAQINFWGGVPGTEAPAGIWQNLLYAELSRAKEEDDQFDKYFDNKTYSRIQRNLALGVADAFMECWDVKFEYWTARPSHVIPDLKIAMPNPHFPGYTSGHSTISRTAAEILAVEVPERKDFWLKNAEEAKQSRLYAGVHFDIDNVEGANLGKKVADQILTKRSGQNGLVEVNKNIDGYKELMESGFRNVQPKVPSADFKQSFIKYSDNGTLISSGKLQIEGKTESPVVGREGFDLEGRIYKLNDQLTNTNFLVADYSTDDGFATNTNAQLVGEDPIWAPGACSAMPLITFEGRYILMADITPPMSVSTDDSPSESIILYDFEKQLFYTLDQTSGNLDDRNELLLDFKYEGDGKVSYYYIHKDQVDVSAMADTSDTPYSGGTVKVYNSNNLQIIKRVIDINTFEYVDFGYEIKEDSNSRYESLFLVTGADINAILLSEKNDDNYDFFLLNDNGSYDKTNNIMGYTKFYDIQVELNKMKYSYVLENVDSNFFDRQIRNRENGQTYRINILSEDEYASQLLHVSGNNTFSSIAWVGTSGVAHTDILILDTRSGEMRKVLNTKYVPRQVGDSSYNAPENYFYIVDIIR